MPRLDGIAVCERLKAHPIHRMIPIVILTASSDRDTKLRGLEAGADDYLTKPFDAKELLIRTKVLLRQRALNERLDATEGVLFALARAVEARDRHTIHHAERVGRYAEAIGGADGLTPEECELLYQGGVLHDLGKIAIPDAILLKPGPLSAEEFASRCGASRTTSRSFGITTNESTARDTPTTSTETTSRSARVSRRSPTRGTPW